MSLPKVFKDFGKQWTDLFKQDEYNMKQPTVEVKLSHANPKANLTAKMESDNNGNVAFELKDKIVCDKYGTLTVKLPTNKDVSLEFENKSGLAENLDLTTKLQCNESVKLMAKYRTSTAATALDIEQTQRPDSNGDVKVTPSVVFGPFCGSRLSLGARAVLKPFDQREVLTEYDVGAEWATSDVTATAKVTDKASKLTIGLGYQVDSAKLFGVEYKFNPNSHEQQMTVGGKYNFTPTSSLRAKVNHTGAVNAVFSQKVNDDVKIAFSSQFNASKLDKGTHAMGVKLTLGDIK